MLNQTEFLYIQKDICKQVLKSTNRYSQYPQYPPLYYMSILVAMFSGIYLASHGSTLKLAVGSTSEGGWTIFGVYL